VRGPSRDEAAPLLLQQYRRVSLGHEAHRNAPAFAPGVPQLKNNTTIISYSSAVVAMAVLAAAERLAVQLPRARLEKMSKEDVKNRTISRAKRRQPHGRVGKHRR